VFGGITAVSRIPNSMEVWWVGDASVEGAYWYEGQPWQRYQLGPPGSASIFGKITAVSRIANSMEVWWVGIGASVQGAYWYEGQPWQRYQLAPTDSAAGGIAAVSRIANIWSRIPSIEVWWVGTNGSIQGASGIGGQPWQRYELAPAGSASVFSCIAAVSRIANSMEVWWKGPYASMEDAYWYDK
jgi:hypothetical protein